MSFSLQMNSWVYLAQYLDGGWRGRIYQKEPISPEAFSSLSEQQRVEVWQKRNFFPEIGLVNYTSQYGLGCFEGLKAYQQKDGSLRLFRPDCNAQRMARSMAGLRMPPFPPELFVEQVRQVVAATTASGEFPRSPAQPYTDSLQEPETLYIRPFTCSEGGIGVDQSRHPFFVIITTPVGNYFEPSAPAQALVSNRVRATPFGTGWIKCAGNYIVSMLAKTEAIESGYLEALFLDSTHHRYLEEGSSCNLFAVLDDGSMVTPELGDTILPGITRLSVIELAKEFGIQVEERKLAIDEVMQRGKELFVVGTAAGVLPMESITYQGQKHQLNRSADSLGMRLRHRLKSIQFGQGKDDYGWMWKL